MKIEIVMGVQSHGWAPGERQPSSPQMDIEF